MSKEEKVPTNEKLAADILRSLRSQGLTCGEAKNVLAMAANQLQMKVEVEIDRLPMPEGVEKISTFSSLRFGESL